MKKSLLSLACAAALLPGVASATGDNGNYVDSASASFTAASASFTVFFSWTDLFSEKYRGSDYFSYEADGTYKIKLTDANNKVIDSFKVDDALSGDTVGERGGIFSYTFLGLVANQTYDVLFTGKWKGSGAGYDLVTAPSVQIATISPLPVVPEPETYAMLLAGLGMVGVIARRRRQS